MGREMEPGLKKHTSLFYFKYGNMGVTGQPYLTLQGAVPLRALQGVHVSEQGGGFQAAAGQSPPLWETQGASDPLRCRNFPGQQEFHSSAGSAVRLPPGAHSLQAGGCGGRDRGCLPVSAAGCTSLLCICPEPFSGPELFPCISDMTIIFMLTSIGQSPCRLQGEGG